MSSEEPSVGATPGPDDATQPTDAVVPGPHAGKKRKRTAA